MKRYDRIVRRLTWFGKKNFITRCLAMILLVPLVLCHRLLHGLTHNLRREALALCALLCVLFSVSFEYYAEENPEDSVTIYNVVEDPEEELGEIDPEDLISLDPEGIYDTDSFLYLDDEEVETATIGDLEFEGYGDASEETDDETDEYFGIGDEGDTPDVNPEDVAALDVTKIDESAYADYIFDPEDWRYILVNKEHPIPQDYVVPLGNITKTMQIDERLIDDLLAMMQGAKNDGVTLLICSPYRSYEKQVRIFNRKVNKYLGRGYSYFEAYKITSLTVTIPGTSEHTLGMSLDIFCPSHKKLNYAFANTAAGKWLASNSYKYGFILRYPKGKTDITGIDYEPWHFRYVGVEAATLITKEGICLEEFVNQYLND